MKPESAGFGPIPGKTRGFLADTKLQPPPGHGGPPGDRRRGIGKRRRPRPRRAGGDAGGPSARPVRDGRGHGEGPEDGGHRWIDGLRRARERAAACPDTRVVSVCDREGDFWELLSGADLHGDALPVRASRPAKRRVPGPRRTAANPCTGRALPRSVRRKGRPVPCSPRRSWTGTAGAGQWRPGSGRRVRDADHGRRVRRRR